MRDAYRDDLEAALLRAEALARENAVLVARNAELERGASAAPAAPVARVAKPPSDLGVLVFCLLLAGPLLAGLLSNVFPEHEAGLGIGFILYMCIPVAIMVLPDARCAARERR